MAMTSCIAVKLVHIVYIVVTYVMIPYVFTNRRGLQALNLINMGLLILHWKILGNHCVLDMVEQRICSRDVYKLNNSVFGIDDLTFSNVVQVLLISAILIACVSLYGRIHVSVRIRLLILCTNLLVVFFVVPLSTIYKVVPA